MKILCVCQGGNTRSVAMAYVLKMNGHDALSIGWKYNSIEALTILCEWSDLIITMTDRIKRKIPEHFLNKVIVIDVGTDRWNSIPKEKELIELCTKLWSERKDEYNKRTP